jgi:hypothetical protein
VQLLVLLTQTIPDSEIFKAFVTVSRQGRAKLVNHLLDTGRITNEMIINASGNVHPNVRDLLIRHLCADNANLNAQLKQIRDALVRD